MKHYLTLGFLLSTLAMFAQAPDFTITDLNGHPHNLNETLSGGKVVLLDFFFVNCPPCQATLPEIEGIVDDFGNTTLEVWSISDRDNNSTIGQSPFAPAHGNHVVAGSEGGGAEVLSLYSDQFNFGGFPTFAIVCSDGSIVWDIWPITAGAPEIRAQLTEECGVTESLTATPAIPELQEALLAPNPAESVSRLRFDLDCPVELSIRVTDVLGRTIDDLGTRRYSAGRQDIEIPTDRYPTGFYRVELRTTKGLKALQLAIIR